MGDERIWQEAAAGAGRALAPFAAEAAAWAADWFARRWPEVARDAVLPALERALGDVAPAANGRRDDGIRRAALTGGAALLGSAATAAFLRR